MSDSVPERTHTARVLAAGAIIIPAWDALLDEALADFPDSTLVYVNGDGAGEHAAQRWCDAWLPFERHEMGGASIITSSDLVDTAEVVLVCLEGWASFAQQCKRWAVSAGVSVREVGGLIGP
jgi:hypothetical protein